MIFSEDDNEPAGLVAEIRESDRIEGLRLPAGSLIRPRGQRVVTMKGRESDNLREVLRHTEVVFDVVAKGSVLGPGFTDMHSEGIEFARTSANFNSADFQTLLRSAGYRLAEVPKTESSLEGMDSWRDPPSAELGRMVLSILDLPASEPFNQEQNIVIEDWIAHARAYKEWPPERIEFLRRIVRDGRVTFAPSFDQVFSRNPSVAAALMPDVLDRLQSMGEGNDVNPAQQAAYGMRHLDPSILYPYASRILGIIAQRGRAGDLMTGVVGRIGVDPGPHLEPMRSAEDGAIIDVKVTAACLAEAKWAPSVIPVLRSVVTEEELGRPRARIESVLESLMRHNDIAFVEHAIQRSKWSDADQIRRRLFGPGRGQSIERYC